MRRLISRFGVPLLAAAVGLAALLSPATATAATGSSYYVDCSQSADGSGTKASPWNSLADVNNHAAFVPGDVIYFAQGTTCAGTLEPLGSGTSAAPITLDSYATTANHDRPIVNGGSGIAALVLSNQQYWTVQNLEFTGGANRNIWVTGNTANTTYSGFTFNNLYVHDTQNYPASNTQWLTDAGGLILDPCNSTTFLTNIVINNVRVHHTYAQGIQVGHESDAPSISTCTTASYTNSVSNVTIENSASDANGAAGAAVYYAKDVTIQDNVFFNNGANGVHGEGSWSYACDHCVWQYNESYGNHLGDGGGFDMDGQTTNSTVQYNYIHDNQGYCVSDFAIGGAGYLDSTNNTIRYNICAHDDTGYTGYDAGEIFVSNFINSGTGITGNQINGLAIYNNTIYANPDISTLPAISLQTVANVPMFATGSTNYFKNNIVYSTTPVLVGTDNAGMTFDYNLYYYTGGTPEFAYNSSTNHTVNYTTFAAYQAGSGQDAHSSVTDPKLNGTGYTSNGMSASADTLAAGSPALGTGTLISGNGGLDVFSNPVSATTAPNIGAYDGAGTAGAAAITGTHVITNGYSKLALDDDAFGTSNGAAVTQWGANGGTNQKWAVTSVGNGYYKIINVYSGLALEDYAWDSQTGAAVDQWAYNGGANQLWSITAVNDTSYRIVNQATGLALDDYAFGTSNGSTVDQWNYHGTSNQFWTFS